MAVVPLEETAGRATQDADLDLSKVSVVIPALNEERSLPLVLNDLPQVGDVIVVDNASTDGTARVAAENGAMVVGYRFVVTVPLVCAVCRSLPNVSGRGRPLLASWCSSTPIIATTRICFRSWSSRFSPGVPTSCSVLVCSESASRAPCRRKACTENGLPAS